MNFAALHGGRAGFRTAPIFMKGRNMTFEAWLTANGYDAEKLNDKQRAHLTSAWKAETQPAPKAEQEAEPKSESGFDQQMAAIEAENDRIRYIQEATVTACARHVGNPDKTKQFKDLCASAIADKKTDKRAYELAVLRLDRSIGPMVMSPSGQSTIDDTVLEAAVCMSNRLPNLDKQFTDQTLQAAHSRFRRGIGLQELLMVAAERNNGYRGSSRDIRAVCHAAFRNSAGGDMYDMRADAGPSTISVPGILSNVANKFLAETFGYGEQSWRQVARIRSANDFKTMTTYRLTGANIFEKVAPGGEIKHGTLSELSYTNRVDTYGKMLGIDRRDIINDDLGAFASATSELGRGAIDSLNTVFWTEWLTDTSFFPTDKSLANYDDGATDSVLSLAGLENADSIFRLQTKPDGTPLGIMPAVLLVPTGLRITGMTLMNSTLIVGQGASAATVPSNNPWAGAFNLVSSVYLTQTALGGSSTAWYLLADPNNVSAIEVAFLMGQDTPTVETSSFDFDRLGLAMRAYMDFGCSKTEYRAAVKLKGAA